MARFNCGSTACLALRMSEPWGTEEMREQAMFDSEDLGCDGAFLSTLRRTRALVQEGQLYEPRQTAAER